MKKEYDFNVKRVIESLEIDDGVSVYKDNITLSNGTIFSYKEGITETKNLEIDDLSEIKSDKRYYLMTQQDLEKIRTLPGYTCEFVKKSTRNLYNYYLLNKDDLVIVYFEPHDETFHFLNDDVCPKVIFFNYISGDITNKYYDLDKLEDYLRKYPDRFYDVYRRKIPYYNATDDCNEEISFVWMPSKKEYQDYYDFKKKNDYFLAYKKAASIISIDKFLKNGED